MDLRGYLAKLEEAGHLKVIEEEIDWNLQAGALCAMSNRVGGPAIHLKRVKGYPGASLAGGLFTGPASAHFKRGRPWSRQAVALGLDADAGYEEFMDQLMTRSMQTIPPLQVTTGPCKENVLTGAEADVLRFPIPFLHQGDGGRYGTSSIVIARDPETGLQSWAYMRWMVVDGHTLVLGPFPFLKAIALIHQKYEAQRQAMPCCIVLGGSPANILAAASYPMPGTAEVDIAGGLARDPVTLVKAETSDLLVPADAEVVIEGEVPPGERAQEGPFPEWVRRSQPEPRPLLRIKAITHRNNPIIPFSAEGDKYSDSLSLTSTMVSLELTKALRFGFGFPVRWVNCPVETCMALCLVSVKNMRSGWPNSIGAAIFGLPFGKWSDKVLVVEDDVEPLDWPQIMKDWGQKCYPYRDVNFFQGSRTFLADYTNSDEKDQPVQTKVVFDCTIPYWWDKSWIPKRVSFETSYPPEIQERVVARWKELGLPGEPPVRRKYR